MSTVADLPHHLTVERPLLARWIEAWSRLDRHHLLGLAVAMLLMWAVDVSALADKLGRPGAMTVLAYDLFSTIVLFCITLLAWSAAVEGQAPSGSRRFRALAVAVLVSGLLSAAIVVPVGAAVNIVEVWWELMGKKKELPPMWLAIAGNTVHLGFYSFLFVTAIEVLRSRASTNAAVRAARRERASVTREMLESRLAAMQAQVEPQFLFNTLVGIEALYQKDATAAAENLDRLIQYLRVALPRLREPGSSIAAELDLVSAYLAVVTSLHGGRPALAVTVGEGCGEARFYPMLLLPLIQRAVRDDDGVLPESIRIGAQKAGDDIVIVTRIDRAGGCDEDFELGRVRERLEGLYGDRAALDCVELDSHTTQFTLRVPAAG